MKCLDSALGTLHDPGVFEMELDKDRQTDLIALASRLGIGFVDLGLLHQSLLHSSYVNEHDLPELEGNERLEFLGDAVLGLVVTEELYRRFREKREGELSKFKSVVVSRKVLAEKAKQLDLGRWICLGKGEELTGGRNRRSILANTFESVVGAIFLSGGVERARPFILQHLYEEIDKVSSGQGLRDYKSELQERVQQEGGKLPRYRVVDIQGPDHDKWYKIEVLLDEVVIGAGSGKSKKSAEQAAAKEALLRIPIDEMPEAWNA